MSKNTYKEIEINGLVLILILFFTVAIGSTIGYADESESVTKGETHDEVKGEVKGEVKDEVRGETYLLVKGSYTRTWYRTLHQLERLNFNVKSADITGGFNSKGVIRVETDIEEENSGLLSFFFPKKTPGKKQIKLIFSEKTHEITRIDIEMNKGEKENSPVVEEFAALLYQYIK